MKNLSKKILALLIGASVFYSSCKKEESLTESIVTSNSGTNVSTSISGMVVDESNNPLANVSITAHGQTTTTNSNGIFMFDDINVPQSRCYVVASSSGYFDGSRSVVPVKDGSTVMKIMLQTRQSVGAINSSTGGVVTLSNGSKIELPANAVVLDDGGAAYSGSVNVYAVYQDPTATNFGFVMPGDLQATRTNGSSAILRSFGMLNVELTGSAGQKLQIATGKEATLTVAIPSSLQGAAQSTIPLWYFDETAGIWKEEGQATLTGGQYVGNVKHFTFWNCDMPYPKATVKGRVIDCNGEPVAGVWISSSNGGYAQTDANGEYEEFASATIAFSLQVNSDLFFGITSNVVNISPLSENQVYEVPDLVVDCPAYVEGTITNCEGQPIEGTVFVEWSSGFNFIKTDNGEFSMPVLSSQSGAYVYVYGKGGESGSEGPFATPAMNNTTDVGDVEACEINLENSFYITGGSYNNELIVLNGPPSYVGATYYSVSQYTSLNAINVNQDASLYMNFPDNTTGTFYSSSTGTNLYLYVPGAYSDSSFANDFTIEVTKYEAVGGKVEGTFSGTFTDYNNVEYTITNGQFSVTRKEDQPW